MGEKQTHTTRTHTAAMNDDWKEKKMKWNEMDCVERTFAKDKHHIEAKAKDANREMNKLLLLNKKKKKKGSKQKMAKRGFISFVLRNRLEI